MANPETKQNVPEKSSFFEYTLDVRRVVTVKTGGRESSYSVLMLVASPDGQFGWGTGTGAELFNAKKKALNKAKKNIIKVNTRAGRTIPHYVSESFGSTNVIIRPAAPGTGIVAGGAVRSILEAIGLKDVVAKIIGSGNKHTVLLSVVKALSSLRSLRTIANSRSKNVKDILPKRSEEEKSPDVSSEK
jgi:small subunit ribosomal protein S5